MDINIDFQYYLVFDSRLNSKENKLHCFIKSPRTNRLLYIKNYWDQIQDMHDAGLGVDIVYKDATFQVQRHSCVISLNFANRLYKDSFLVSSFRFKNEDDLFVKWIKDNVHVT